MMEPGDISGSVTNANEKDEVGICIEKAPEDGKNIWIL